MTHSDCLRSLADDWERYSALREPDVREDMRRALVAELEHELLRMGQECGYYTAHPAQPGLWTRLRRALRTHSDS